MSSSRLMQAYMAAGVCQEGHQGAASPFRPRLWNLYNVTFATSHPLKQVTRPTQSQGAGKSLHLLMMGAAKYCDHAFHNERWLGFIFTSPHILVLIVTARTSPASISPCCLWADSSKKHLHWSLGAWGLRHSPWRLPKLLGCYPTYMLKWSMKLQTIDHHVDVLAVIAAYASIHRCTDQTSNIPGHGISQVIFWYPQVWPIISPKASEYTVVSKAILHVFSNFLQVYFATLDCRLSL